MYSFLITSKCCHNNLFHLDLDDSSWLFLLIGFLLMIRVDDSYHDSC
jgi:hypothetical protein